MKKLLYLLLLFPIFLTAQPRYGVEGIPMCWTISGIDSNITRYVLISSTGSPTQTIAWENAAGQVINVTGGYLRYGYCDCAGGGGGGNGIYGGSGTLPAALVQVQNTNGIKFVEPGTQNGILIANKPNGAAAIALDPTYTDSIRNGLVWKQGADSAAIGIDKDGKLQLLSNDWVTIGNDQAKIIITKDDAVILIKTEGGGVYALPDAVPLAGKNNIMLYPNGSPLGRFANLDSLVDGRLRKDTTVVVLSENKVVDFDFADTRRYSNVYFVGKGVTDTAQLIFLNPPNSDQFGTVFHMKADSGGVAVKFNASQGANNKNGYFLQPGQRAEIRALYDAVAGFELWEVVILWDSIVRDKSIYTDNGTIPAGMRTLTMSGSLLLNNPTTATGSSTKLFDEVRQKLPGNASKWYSRSSYYEARNVVAIRGYPTWYELVQGNGWSMYEWYNGIGWDTTNNVFHYLYGGRYSSSFLSFAGTRPASGIAYQNTPTFEFKYTNGNGLSTSEVINVTATTGLLFSLRQDGRITFGNNGASYYFPITAPSVAIGRISKISWTGNGTVATPGYEETIKSSATLDFPSLSPGVEYDLTITVSGATEGDITSIGYTSAAIPTSIFYMAWVSAANTVTVRCLNRGGGTIDLPATIYKVLVTK